MRNSVRHGMKPVGLSAARDRMNRLGGEGRPFLFIIDFLCRAPVVVPLDEIDSRCLLFDINGHTNAPEAVSPPPPFAFEREPPPFDRYRSAFATVQEHLRRGDTYLLNLTLPTRITTTLTLRQIFQFSKARYRVLCEDRWTVFSPEPFVRIEKGVIRSFPMKGTIDAAIPNAAEIILNDPKEQSEHATIVDLIRNDLSIVASRVRVEEYRKVERISTSHKDLLQVSSTIAGRLPEGYRGHLGDIVLPLLPAGSVSGAPKEKTVEVISAAEGYDRGYFSGVCGVFDGGCLDSGVMIRFIERLPDGFFYKSGGGITALSDVHKEYQELVDKVYVPIVRDDPGS